MKHAEAATHILIFMTISIMAALMFGCEGGGSSPATPVAKPALVQPQPIVSQPIASPTPSATPSPTPSATPSATPTPTPTPTPSPTPTVVQNSTYGSYSCDLLSNGHISCSDGTHSLTTGNTDPTFLGVIVGNGVACGYADSMGQPTSCANMNISCPNPYADAAAYCWNQAASSETFMKTTKQLGFNNNYNGGPVSITASGGNLCITQAIFANLSTPSGQFVQNYTQCGSTVDTVNGYLQ